MFRLRNQQNAGGYIDRPYVVGKVQLAKSQIRKAGYRLAALLNEIFK